MLREVPYLSGTTKQGRLPRIGDSLTEVWMVNKGLLRRVWGK